MGYKISQPTLLQKKKTKLAHLPTDFLSIPNHKDGLNGAYIIIIIKGLDLSA